MDWRFFQVLIRCMNRFFPHPLNVLRTCGAVCIAALASCNTPAEKEEEKVAEVAASASADPTTLSATEWSLLEMGFDEAKAISAQHAEVGTLFKVAGDVVEVLKQDAEGKPLKVRAKGHVFVEMPLMNRATALCEEATITLRDAHLKGTPMLKQGARVARSTGKSTTFWVTDRLQVLGRFDLVKLDEPATGIGASNDVALAELLRTPESEMADTSLKSQNRR